MSLILNIETSTILNKDVIELIFDFVEPCCFIWGNRYEDEEDTCYMCNKSVCVHCASRCRICNDFFNVILN